MQTLNFNQDSIVVFVGAMGTGKSTFAKKHFPDHYVVETDNIRKQLTGDFEDQTQNTATFEILYATLDARAKAGLFTVVDSTGSRSVLQEVYKLHKKYNRDIYIVQFPHLAEYQLTEERMKHRVKYLHVYHNQVYRIDNTDYLPEYYVYDLESIDDVAIEFESYDEDHILSNDYNYVVVPDLHGEHDVIEVYSNHYKDDDNVKFIFLGDIVDRGKSSWRTFCVVNELIKSGKAHGVISNHDNKLMRYFGKWLKDPSLSKYSKYDDRDTLPTYGMKLAFGGLDVTLLEFYSLANVLQDAYARDFVNYYNDLPAYLKMIDDTHTRFFSHAGLTQNIIMGGKLGKADISAVLYDAIDINFDINPWTKNTDKSIEIHVGHEFISEQRFVSNACSDIHHIIKNDIGLGKREYVLDMDVLDFIVIENLSEKKDAV